MIYLFALIAYLYINIFCIREKETLVCLLPYQILKEKRKTRNIILQDYYNMKVWFYVNSITHNRRDENLRIFFSLSPALPIFCCVSWFFMILFSFFLFNSDWTSLAFLFTCPHWTVQEQQLLYVLWLFYSPLLHTRQKRVQKTTTVT